VTFLLFLFNFDQNQSVLTDFDKSPKHEILRKSRLSVQADRRTDMTREIDAFLWCFAKDSEKNKRYLARVCITETKGHVDRVF